MNRSKNFGCCNKRKWNKINEKKKKNKQRKMQGYSNEKFIFVHKCYLSIYRHCTDVFRRFQYLYKTYTYFTFYLKFIQIHIYNVHCPYSLDLILCLFFSIFSAVSLLYVRMYCIYVCVYFFYFCCCHFVTCHHLGRQLDMYRRQKFWSFLFNRCRLSS